MSIGTVALASLLFGALAMAVVEAIATPRFRGPAFEFGPVLRTASLLEARPSRGRAQLALAPDGQRFVMRRTTLGVPSPLFVVGTIEGPRNSPIIQARLSLGGPGALGLAAALCGHLSGKLNPFLSEPITPSFVAMATLALLLAVATWRAIVTLRHDAEDALARLADRLPS